MASMNRKYLMIWNGVTGLNDMEELMDLYVLLTESHDMI